MTKVLTVFSFLILLSFSSFRQVDAEYKELLTEMFQVNGSEETNKAVIKQMVRMFKQHYPNVNLIQGNGKLFWAGGMRLGWRTALKSKEYDAFLLLNDDVIKWKHKSEIQFDTTGLSPSQTAEKIYGQINF